ncbi:YlmC/YmxH family sporulation protein [Lentibacillus saliphilus]|uniref:YlmC/YmxH family sporulation protein n=1 Tax=Lentibacillus saliphilus TaxID=2737028 RepID=UPI003CCEAA8A
MLLSELQIKEVIIVENGTRLGHISDLEINEQTGRIVALILYHKKSGVFGKAEEIVIPWNHIVTIGSDVILIHEAHNPDLYPKPLLLE